MIVEADDVAGLAGAMERLLSNPMLARTYSEQGIVQARRFSWDASAARLMEAYLSAVERRRLRS